MKCKIFYGTFPEAIDAFNKWAKGKALTKDMLIKPVTFPTGDWNMNDGLAILVFHPEGVYWDIPPVEKRKEKAPINREELDRALGRSTG